MSDKRFTASKPSGHIIVSGPDGFLHEADTLQCVHCGMHWELQPGSGKIRGYCGRCNGPVCGPKCAECVPIERQLEIIENGNRWAT